MCLCVGGKACGWVGVFVCLRGGVRGSLEVCVGALGCVWVSGGVCG